ncbi:MAG: GNAT family N-acetyltransferase [Bacillota bacterium]
MILRPIETPEEVRTYEAMFSVYLTRDILLESDFGDPLTPEEFAYYSSDAYRSEITRLCARPVDPVHRYFMMENGERIGFIMCCTYHSEDGKCYVMETCIEPPYRGLGLGKNIFTLLKDIEQATYYELSTSSVRAKRFWESQGFRLNGYGMDGSVMMLLPPAESTFACEELREKDFPQLLALAYKYKREIGEPPMTEAQQAALREAIAGGRIRFFVAKRQTRVVGMCSVCRFFSTYQCRASGIFEDFYIEPVFRGQGIARMLTNYVQKACIGEGISSLWVGCSPGDTLMYQALGFSVLLGNLLTWNLGDTLKAAPPK